MCSEYFNPRFPRGKRRLRQLRKCIELLFQSTLPAGEATGRGVDTAHRNGISIHASRGGSDIENNLEIRMITDFNPRFPRGKRRRRSTSPSRTGSNFNPRFPRGKRLPPVGAGHCQVVFQSTLPAGEATGTRQGDFQIFQFQSTLPAGEATG